MLADARGAPACSASLRTQTRPATESVSGEEALRPKSRLLAPIVGQRGDGDVVVSPYNCSAGEQYSRCSFLLSHSASPCKIHRRALHPSTTLEWAPSPTGGPRDRLEPVRQLRHCRWHKVVDTGTLERVADWSPDIVATVDPRGPGTDPRNGPFAGHPPRRYLLTWTWTVKCPSSWWYAATCSTHWPRSVS